MKDAARLLVYLIATVLLGALLAPPLFWAAQSVPFLARFDFENVFHRALLLAAVILIWPLIRSLAVRSQSDLQLEKNPNWLRDWLAGFVLSAIPLLCCGAILLATHLFSIRGLIYPSGLFKVVGAAAIVPLIEEIFFRGIVLGLLLRAGKKWIAIAITSALYSIVHFLKSPEETALPITWTSGFNSITHAFVQFADPILVAAGFTTLFLIGWILADARLRTRSLWLPIGLHGGWILSNGVFNKLARRDVIALPWLGKNLLVGIVPLGVACLTWLIVRAWLKYVSARNA